jgi:uncharacterized protein YbbK (DUF523 family)
LYDGTFTGVLASGDGLFTTLLKEHGFGVCTELDLPQPEG